MSVQEADTYSRNDATTEHTTTGLATFKLSGAAAAADGNIQQLPHQLRR
jgi:hypothetical protein